MILIFGVSGCRSSRVPAGERLWDAMEIYPAENTETYTNNFPEIVAPASTNTLSTKDMCLVDAQDTNTYNIGTNTFNSGTAITSNNFLSGNFVIDNDFKPVLGTYYYKISWRGIGVGDAAVRIGKEGDFHTIEIRAGTGKKLDLFYKVRYRGKSKMKITPQVTAVEAEIDAKVKNRERKTKLEFNNNGEVDFNMIKKKKGRVRKVKSMEIKPKGFVLDPFSAACLVRRLEWKVGTDAVFDIITGNKVYALHLTCTKTETIKVKNKERKAWVIVPTVKEIQVDNKEHINQEHEDNVNKSNVEIYMAMDGTKDILRIEGHHKVGTVKAEIEKFKPAI